MTAFAVTSVVFNPDGGAVLELVFENDLKANGVQMHRRLVVPGSSQYDDEVDAVRDAAGALLMDVLEDFAGLETLTVDETEDDDDDD